jgi:hypothetical protein
MVTMMIQTHPEMMGWLVGVYVEDMNVISKHLSNTLVLLKLLHAQAYYFPIQAIVIWIQQKT